MRGRQPGPRSYASDDEEWRYLSSRNIAPNKPAPIKSLLPPLDNTTFSTCTTPSISFPSPARSYTPLAPSVRKSPVSTSTARSASFRVTSGSESAQNRLKGTPGIGTYIGSTSRASSTRVGVLRNIGSEAVSPLAKISLSAHHFDQNLTSRRSNVS